MSRKKSSKNPGPRSTSGTRSMGLTTYRGKISSITGLTPATVNASFRRLEEIGMVGELTGRERSRRFGYLEYISILNEGTEPIRALHLTS